MPRAIFADEFYDSAIPNGVVNSFSTVIIRDMVRKSSSNLCLSRLIPGVLGFLHDEDDTAQVCGRRYPDSRSPNRRNYYIERSKL
jgi:hypothetical protein